ncbi:MAG: MarR family transcriptional regulator [Candidatus Andeanibacterium colombiense]|uniref:MarR family transcriptional regulator n=1 Tax=Candidatus Andeanibacterium colombiense TaxID=3121345 RepID=A0AAJ5X0X5_9SPHN|nr:MAG: MarR family transcriptional regulator [Sphingomonadaceae bacterium]
MSSTEPVSTTELAQGLRAFVRALRRRLREQADFGDLTPSQMDAILRLDADGPSTTSSLARAAGIRPQSMGTVVAALNAAGLVHGAPDPADGRQTLLSLTERCRDWLFEARALRDDWLTSTLEQMLSPAERAQIAATLPLLSRLVERAAK